MLLHIYGELAVTLVNMQHWFRSDSCCTAAALLQQPKRKFYGKSCSTNAGGGEGVQERLPTCSKRHFLLSKSSPCNHANPYAGHCAAKTSSFVSEWAETKAETTTIQAGIKKLLKSEATEGERSAVVAGLMCFLCDGGAAGGPVSCVSSVCFCFLFRHDYFLRNTCCW